MTRSTFAALIALFIMGTPASAETIKSEMILGCFEKEVAKTITERMADQRQQDGQQDEMQFGEECEVFMQGELVDIIERADDEGLMKVKRSDNLKTYWIPIRAITE